MRLSRRSFLGSSALLGASGGRAAGQAPERPARFTCSRASLPVLRTADVVVAGGSFGGIAVALALSAAGRKVVLIERRTYLGREVTATLRPWCSPSCSRPEWFARFAPAGSDDEVPLHVDRLKLALDDLLLEANVELLYCCYPIALDPAGLIVANKSGRQVLRCGTVVDATASGVVSRFAGASFASPLGPAVFRRTLEFDGVGPLEQRTITVPASLGIEGNEVRLHPGAVGPGHVLVECGFRLPAVFDPLEDAKRETAARKLSIAVASHLVNQHPAFRKAFLARTSYELHGPAPAMVKEPSVRGVWRLREETDLCASASAGSALARKLIELGAASANDGRFDVKQETPVGSGLELMEPDSPRAGRYEEAPVLPQRVPVWREVDVLVVGGGSSGATAAAVAAREGVRTMLLEMNPALGGTGTMGCVDSYWFGHHVGFVSRVKERVKAVERTIGFQPPQAMYQKWSVEAKMHALLLEAEGAEVVFGAIVAGTIVERGNRVRGVLAATRYGPRVILSKALIDCTGDGDVAAFAGAEAVKGSAMDHNVMWYSLSQLGRPGKYVGSFTSSLDVGDIEDYTRGILLGRRRGKNCSDHAAYLAPRESRHIAGDATITMTDLFRQRRWSDVINIHFSNSDMKGKTTSPWFLAGLIAPQFEAEIPYGACLPRGLDGILVGGKAFSTTHDALAGIRMQADLENLGGVLALAAAKAVKQGKSVRSIDIAELQQRLVKEEILPPAVLRRRLRPARADLKRIVEQLLDDKPLLEYQNMKHYEVFRGPVPFVEACAAGPRIVPLLEAALPGAPAERRIVIAQALSVLGSRSGVPVLLEALETMLSGSSLPVQDHKVLYSQLPPDHGAMPKPCHLLYSLGMARDKRALTAWNRVADLFHPGEEDFRKAAQNPYHYVDSVCYGAERLGNPGAIPTLKRMHQQGALKGLTLRSGLDTDLSMERRATLELALGKALARCGSAEGFLILIPYLEDVRALLAEQAHSNLVAISGRDEGRDREAWLRWLNGGELKTNPLSPADDRDAWFESAILVLA